MLDEAPVDLRQYPVLVVDDEEAIVKTFKLNYARDFTIVGTSSPTEALRLLEDEPIAVLVTDQRMPEMAGTDLIQRALELKPGLVPIILTGFADVEALVKAVNLRRVYRYVAKPWDRNELRETIAGAIEMFHVVRQNAKLAEENGRLVAEIERVNEQLRRENRFLKEQSNAGGFAAIIGRSPALQRVIDRARRVASSTATVLIEGPTGTGKELLARAIHEASPRRQKLFVAINAGTMTETLLSSTLFGHRRGSFTGATADQKGLFEVASGGTLFLDEIGETTPALQVHLLRVLQEGEIQAIGALRPTKVDVRVIAATNRDLEAEAAAGRFREDLLHRLKVFPLQLPPLDELENLIERALLLSDPGEPIEVDDLFDTLPSAQTRSETRGTATLQADVLRFEYARLQETLAQCDGNKSEAARRLGLTRVGFLKKLKRCEQAVGVTARE